MTICARRQRFIDGPRTRIIYKYYTWIIHSMYRHPYPKICANICRQRHVLWVYLYESQEFPLLLYNNILVCAQCDDSI